MAYLTIRDFADKYHIPIATVYGWSAAKKLPEPDEIIGRTKRWREEVLHEWIKTRGYKAKVERKFG